jgi:hypothetical protein
MLYQVELLAYAMTLRTRVPASYLFIYLRRILCGVRLRSLRQYFLSCSLGVPSATLISVR